MLKESCVGSYLAAKEAYINGADRIELCNNLAEGGTTPSYGTIKKAVTTINLPINVIIRPRGGNFVYSDEEFEIMLDDIKVCKDLKVNGIVFGILDEQHKIDRTRTGKIVALASGLKKTFHMAFDEIGNKKEAIDTLVALKIDSILTKGGENCALDNLHHLKQLIDYANGRITIIPGGGITQENSTIIIKETGAKEVHGSKIV